MDRNCIYYRQLSFSLAQYKMIIEWEIIRGKWKVNIRHKLRKILTILRTNKWTNNHLTPPPPPPKHSTAENEIDIFKEENTSNNVVNDSLIRIYVFIYLLLLLWREDERKSLSRERERAMERTKIHYIH